MLDGLMSLMSQLAAALGKALQPIKQGLEAIPDGEGVKKELVDYLKSLGIPEQEAKAAVAPLEGIKTLLDSVDALREAAEANLAQIEANQEPTHDMDLDKIVDAWEALKTVFENIGGLDGAYVEAFLINWLMAAQPKVYHWLLLLAVIKSHSEESKDDPDVKANLTNPDGTDLSHKRIRWDKLKYFLFLEGYDVPGYANDIRGFSAILNTAYKWGTADFFPELLIKRIHNVMKASNSKATLVAPDAVGSPWLAEEIVGKVIKFPLKEWAKPDEDPTKAFGLMFHALKPTSEGGTDGGLGLFLFGFAHFPGSKKWSFGKWELALEGNAQVATKAFGLAFRPGSYVPDVVGGGANITAAASIGMNYTETWKILELGGKQGDVAGFGITMKSFGSSLGLAVNTAGPTVDLKMSHMMEELKFALVAGPALDSFLSSLLPEEGIAVTVKLGLEFSTTGGVNIISSISEDNAGLIIPILLGLALGPLLLEAMELGIKPRNIESSTPSEEDNVGADITTLLKFQVKLGVIDVTVDGLGFGITSEFGKGGNLGFMDVGFGIEPPKGLGLKIEIPGVLSGGGYLWMDHDLGIYKGVFSVAVVSMFEVTVIFIIDTNKQDDPDKPDTSILALLTATFGAAGLQIGFGFAITGLGGLLGIHRTLDVDALRSRLKTGALDSIMFPEDPINRAMDIFEDLEAIFPGAQDRIIFGPMLAINWGGGVVDLQIAVIMEVPSPIVIALLGKLRLALPTKEAALIDLRLDLMGVLDMGAKTLEVFGTLANSHVVGFELNGDLCLWVGWGKTKGFIMSFGGFHPDYDKVPPQFSDMERLTFSTQLAGVIHFSLQAYVAVTSNSFQFGAGVNVKISPGGGIEISGHLSFDVMFEFSPFRFCAGIKAGVSLKVFGYDLLSISLEFNLCGPGPWNAKGKGRLKIIFFTIKVNFDVSWGDSEAITMPTIKALPLLLAALENPDAWDSSLPEDMDVGVRSVAEAAEDYGVDKEEEASADDGRPLFVHPLGTLSVNQMKIPLNQTIDKVGNELVEDCKEFTISSVAIGNLPVTIPGSRGSWIQSEFAPGQYITMGDAEKLSAPSVEDMDGGVKIGPWDNSMVTHTTEVNHLHFTYDEARVRPESNTSRLTRDMYRHSLGAVLGGGKAGYKSGMPNKAVTDAAKAAAANGKTFAKSRIARAARIRLRNGHARKYNLKNNAAARAERAPAFSMEGSKFRVVDKNTMKDVVGVSGTGFGYGVNGMTYSAAHATVNKLLDVQPTSDLMIISEADYQAAAGAPSPIY